MFPYASYLRFVNLRDLDNLINQTPRFRLKIEKYFFHDLRLQHKTVVEGFGDAIIEQNAMIEGVSGKLGIDALQRWTSRLPRLRSLDLYEGEALAHEKTQQLICEKCPYFRELEILFWTNKEADRHLGPFFEKLPAQSLRRLKTTSSCGIASRTALALNNHSETLSDLNLILEPGALSALGDLKSCVNLQKLYLKLTSDTNLQVVQSETFDVFSAWLGACKYLKELTLINIESAQGAIIPLLLHEDIRLRELTIGTTIAPFFTDAYPTFHYALSHQKELTSLCLWGDGESGTPEAVDSLIESVAQLTKLKKWDVRGQHFEIRGLMENFEDDHIIRLLLGLSQLEDVFIGGQFVTDQTLDVVGGSLPNLKRWTIMAPSRFSTDALLRFIDRLDETGNEGLQLSVDMADPEHLLSTEEQQLVRSALSAKAKGSFDYTPWREPDASDSDDYSD